MLDGVDTPDRILQLKRLSSEEMMIKDCPECKNPVGLVSSESSWWDTTGPTRTILQCSFWDLEPHLRPENDWNRYLELKPCGYETELPADIEAHMEERPRLFK